MNHKDIINEYKCPVCGKLFYGSNEWVYTICVKDKSRKSDKHSVFKRKVCSWSCMRKHERENPQPFKWKGYEQCN